MSKASVVYFTASGVTAKMAERLAEETGAVLFEIEPETPYTEGDLDRRDKASRSSVEMNDRESRPAIRSRVEDMDQYDVVFVGFPVWWYRESSIIDTFMEAYNFRGKTVVPFVTFGGSQLGDSAKYMQALSSGAEVMAGKRFSADVSGKELAAWALEWI